MLVIAMQNQWVGGKHQWVGRKTPVGCGKRQWVAGKHQWVAGKTPVGWGKTPVGCGETPVGCGERPVGCGLNGGPKNACCWEGGGSGGLYWNCGEEDSGLTSLRRESNHLEDLLWDPFGLDSIGLFQGRVILVIAHNLCRSTCQPPVPYTI